MRIFLLFFSAMVLLSNGPVFGGDGVSQAGQAEVTDPLVIPISNEVSFYKNVDDDGVDRGTTLQIISINQFNVGTDFIIEFTGDFNWDLDFYEDHDYYIELSLVKPVYKSLSVNYQRIYGTFASGPINQIGLRWSFFSGS